VSVFVRLLMLDDACGEGAVPNFILEKEDSGGGLGGSESLFTQLTPVVSTLMLPHRQRY
jgi:hypothetical protein